MAEHQGFRLIPFDGAIRSPLPERGPGFRLVPVNLPTQGTTTTIAAKNQAPRQGTKPEEAAFALGDVFSQQRQNTQGLTPAGVISKQALRSFLDNTLAIPSVVADAVRVNPFRDAANLVQGKPPQSVLGTTPRLTTADIGAGVSVAAGLPKAVAQGNLNVARQFQAAKQQQQARQFDIKQEFPISTAIGRVGGDVATLLTGRAPFTRALARPASATRATSFAPGASRIADRALKSPAMQKLARGARRSTEAGLEGASLAILNGGDPVETAAFAAGGQAVGSAALTLGKLPLSLKGLAGTAIAVTALFQLFKSATPGGKDRVLESSESAFNKILFGIGVGALAGLAGLGRLRGGKLAEDLPKITDAITAIPRAAALSLLTEFTKEGDGSRIEPIVQKLAENPGFFLPIERRQLERALTSESVSVLNTIDSLMRSDAFKEKVEALTGTNGR